MTTREKIIVGFMCLTILYGAYELLGNRSTHNRKTFKIANPIDELKEFTASVTKKLFDEKVTKEYRYLISQAGNSWTKDPFIRSIVPLKKQLTLPSMPQKSLAKKAKSNYVYTGFLQLGDKKIAVINGMEYTQGESLDTNGLYIKNIFANKVVLAKVNGRDTIQVPLIEIDPTFKNQTP